MDRKKGPSQYLRGIEKGLFFSHIMKIKTADHSLQVGTQCKVYLICLFWLAGGLVQALEVSLGKRPENILLLSSVTLSSLIILQKNLSLSSGSQLLCSFLSRGKGIKTSQPVSIDETRNSARCRPRSIILQSVTQICFLYQNAQLHWWVGLGST